MSHLVNNSWLPILLSSAVFLLLLNTTFSFKKGEFSPFITMFRVLYLVGVFILWVRDVLRERRFQGHHTFLVQSNLKWGLLWFLFREVWFFFSIFWTFFHMCLYPLRAPSNEFPVLGVQGISFLEVPLLNTIILLIRGVTATLAHHSLLGNHKSEWLLVSSLLGGYFLSLQWLEYSIRSFAIYSRVYGRVFFIGTGFHGFHVVLGTLILLTSHFRQEYRQVTSSHHFGVEFSLWYWHFVDVVWIFLYLLVYYWGR